MAKDNETRLRIRSAIRLCVDEVWCLFYGNNDARKEAWVQVYLRGGELRHYTICHELRRAVAPIRPAQTKSGSVDRHGQGMWNESLDMRNCDDRPGVIALYGEISQRAVR